MKLTGNEDRRVLRTIRGIKRAFIDMMNERPYEKITVKELAERASINKKTFYFYYSSLYDLLIEMQDEILDQYMSRVQEYGLKNIRKCIEEFFLFFSDTEPGIYRVVARDSTGLLFHKFIALDEEQGGPLKKYWDTLDDYTVKLLISYLNMSILQSLSLWIEGGKEIPLSRAVETTSTLALHGILGLLEKRNILISKPSSGASTD